MVAALIDILLQGDGMVYAGVVHDDIVPGESLFVELVHDTTDEDPVMSRLCAF